MALQLAVNLLTIVMSGVVAAVVTYKLNANRDERRFLRQKLEDAFISFNGFTRQLGTFWLVLTRVMSGVLDYDKAFEINIAQRNKNEERHFEKLRMLLSLYWPELLSHFHDLEQVQSEGNQIVADHKKRYLAGHVKDEESFKKLCAAIERLEGLEKTFVLSAQEAAKKLRGVG